MHLNAPPRSVDHTSSVSNQFTASPPNSPAKSTAVQSAADQQHKKRKPTPSPVEPTTVSYKAPSGPVFPKEPSPTLRCSRTQSLVCREGLQGGITLHKNLSQILMSSCSSLLIVQRFGPKPVDFWSKHSAKMVRDFGTACQRGSGLQTVEGGARFRLALNGFILFY